MIASPAPQPRLIVLDGLRGVAIILVMLSHATRVATDVRIDRFFGFWTNGGWSGVDLFFVLSGFLITGILFDAKGGPRYFRNFYIRRILRIFPLYYGFLLVAFVVVPRISPAVEANMAGLSGTEVWYWIYLSNASIGVAGDWHGQALDHVDISWSLSIEEQFYIVWPLIVFALDRRRLMMVCGSLVALALVWRLALLGAGASPVSVYVLTPGRVDSLAIGAFVALALRGQGDVGLLVRLARPVMVVCGLLLLAMAISAGGFGVSTPAMQIVGYPLFAMLFGGLLVLAVASSPLNRLVRALQHPVLRTYGRYSYAMYLTHLPVQALIPIALGGLDRFPLLFGSALPGQMLFYALGIGLPIVPGWLSWHLYEKHFIRLKKLVPYEKNG
jgi:peptidoglycan/LPS O-acetylase OafA/YrhL